MEMCLFKHVYPYIGKIGDRRVQGPRWMNHACVDWQLPVLDRNLFVCFWPGLFKLLYSCCLSSMIGVLVSMNESVSPSDGGNLQIYLCWRLFPECRRIFASVLGGRWQDTDGMPRGFPGEGLVSGSYRMLVSVKGSTATGSCCPRWCWYRKGGNGWLLERSQDWGSKRGSRYRLCG